MKAVATRLTATALAATALLAAEAVSAAEPLIDEPAIPGEFSANIGFTSEYYFRGISQTDDTPAVQGGFDYSVGLAESVSLYLGIWGSNLKFNDASLEADLYGGLNGDIGDTGLSWDAGFIYYAYPGAADTLNYDFVEAQGALGYDFGFASVTASLNYAPENFADSGNAYYPKLAVSVPLGKYVTVDGYFARQYVEDNAAFGFDDYDEWNLSATVNVVGFDTTLAYTDTDISGDVDGTGPAILLTVSRSF
jgi:uncharacterized protein (TIGR02001 family)